MVTLDLSGKWTVVKKGSDDEIPATVPGCIHTDLLAGGRIEDPFYRDREIELMWIGESDWIYKREFILDDIFLSHERILLRCEGLDTFARITVNGHRIGEASNSFRVWEFDLKPYLHAGNNHIEVLFRSPFPFIKAKQKQRALFPMEDRPDRIAGVSWIRKSQCNFGWDWGPKCVTCGIWRPIKIVAFDKARIEDIRITQVHEKRNSVILEVEVIIERLCKNPLIADVRVGFGRETIYREKAVLKGKIVRQTLVIKNPRLWWPNGMGAQPLYVVTIELVAEKGDSSMVTVTLDKTVKRIGLRTLRLVQRDDARGKSFAFEVNGKEFFAKGANWIPADTFVTRLTPERYEDLISSTVEANMNMLRVWGGGIYEDDAFYELCDRCGICIWQDFMFSCSAYPAFDTDFLAEVKAEVEGTVKRLRHHPSIALWCGNNELEQGDGFIKDDRKAGQMSWAEYKKLFDKLIPAAVMKLDPSRDYWPSSPHSPCGDRNDYNNPACGDAHLWDVWHGRQPFEWYRTCEHRFNSEFGFQSFPEPRTVESYTAPEDRNISSYIMEHHQRSGIGNAAIIQYMLDWFKLPSSFEMTLWLSQILQGMAVKYAVEHWRRKMPEGMGTLYWQLNDCWPVASWSSIDYEGNRKALQYMAKRFFAPFLVSGLEDIDKGTVEVHVTSDLLKTCEGTVICNLTDTHGNRIRKEELPVRIPAQKNRRITTFKLKDELNTYGKRRLMLWLELKVEGKTVSSNFVSFVRPKHLELREPMIKTAVKQGKENSFIVTLRSNDPALWVWPDLSRCKARYSDRFFHIPPFRWVKITVYPERELTLSKFHRMLKIYSLVDTYRSS